MKIQHNKILQLIVFCLLLMSCILLALRNEGKPLKYTIVIKKLDNGYLDTIKSIGKKNQEIQLIENDSVIELIDEGDVYLERRKKKNEVIYSGFAYDKKNNLMFQSGTYFYDFSIGVFRRYNGKGELTEEVNRDKNYAFSVYDLIEKIKLTHQIDLNNPLELLKVERNFDKSLNKYVYIIRYHNDENPRSKYIAIDGQTGEILDEGTTQVICPVR